MTEQARIPHAGGTWVHESTQLADTLVCCGTGAALADVFTNAPPVVGLNLAWAPATVLDADPGTQVEPAGSHVYLINWPQVADLMAWLFTCAGDAGLLARLSEEIINAQQRIEAFRQMPTGFRTGIVYQLNDLQDIDGGQSQ